MSAVIFLGNGINRAFDQVSWAGLIEKIHEKYNPDTAYNAKSPLPMPMQIIVATNDNVNKAMQDMAKEMMFEITTAQKEFLESVLQLPVENIITANYTFEIEQAANIKNSMPAYRQIRQFTKKCSPKEKQFNLFKNYRIDAYNKTVWHVHGDIATPSSLIMGSYYYGNLLSEIRSYIPSFMKRYAYSQKNETALAQYSWVDTFLSQNVYMLGFGMDFNETDIWWLICCKKRHFSDTKVYFYQPPKDISDEKRALLNAYDVVIIDELPFEENEYIPFYNHALKDIRARIENKAEGEMKNVQICY